jgi:predicted transcriptional regulator
MLLKTIKRDVDKIKHVATMLQLLHNEKTFVILQLLCDHKVMCVTDLVIKSNLVQTEISGILSKLKKYDIVKCTTDGKKRNYKINAARFEHITNTIKNYLNNNPHL